MQEIIISIMGGGTFGLLAVRVAWQQLNKRLENLEKDHVGKGWVNRRSEAVDKLLDLKQNSEACEIQREGIYNRIQLIENNAEIQRLENKEDHKAIITALDSFTKELAENTKCLHLLAAGGDCKQ